MTIGILYPQSGNITSICDALVRLNRAFRVLDKPNLKGIRQIVLPGQGRFGPVMRFLEQNGWVTVLRDWAAEGRPLLGICVGMQILFESSEEDPSTPGLGILEGRVTRLEAFKLPLIGWATVHWQDGRRQAAYFVNSYAVAEHPHAVATTHHGNRFCAGIAKGALQAFQFHPEKSGAMGKELLQSCLIS